MPKSSLVRVAMKFKVMYSSLLARVVGDWWGLDFPRLKLSSTQVDVEVGVEVGVELGN